MNLFGVFRSYDHGPPRWYRCMYCGERGIKLWRVYQAWASRELECAECAEVRQRKVHERGWVSEWLRRGYNAGCSIGFRVPAVLAPGATRRHPRFWAYTAIPEEAWEWWKNLPEGN